MTLQLRHNIPAFSAFALIFHQSLNLPGTPSLHSAVYLLDGPYIVVAVCLSTPRSQAPASPSPLSQPCSHSEPPFHVISKRKHGQRLSPSTSITAAKYPGKTSHWLMITLPCQTIYAHLLRSRQDCADR